MFNVNFTLVRYKSHEVHTNLADVRFSFARLLDVTHLANLFTVTRMIIS